MHENVIPDLVIIKSYQELERRMEKKQAAMIKKIKYDINCLFYLLYIEWIENGELPVVKTLVYFSDSLTSANFNEEVIQKTLECFDWHDYAKISYTILEEKNGIVLEFCIDICLKKRMTQTYKI